MAYRPASRQDLAKYWGRYHFQPWVYNLLNAAFIFSLCKSTPLGTVQSPGHTEVDVQFSSDCKVTEFELVRQMWYKLHMDTNLMQGNKNENCDMPTSILGLERALWRLYQRHLAPSEGLSQMQLDKFKINECALAPDNKL